MNKDSYTPCTKCGRPMRYCKGECCGKKPEGCDCREYGCKHNACIREKNPDCPYEAVIPSVTVETINNLKDLADCFVHVEDINTTFYIDDKHRIMVTWAGLVSADDYDFDANPLNVRSQIIYDAKNNKAAIYDNKGAHYIFQISDIENDYMLLENKPAINGVTLEGDKSLKELDIVATFDTVADMKAATSLVNGATVRTLGFYAVGDGGGAVYKITNTGTANEMDVIAVGPLRANLDKSGDVYAEQFGAKPIADFDNRSIITYALSAASTLHFGPGDFYTSDYITLNSGNHLFGDHTKIYSDDAWIFKGSGIDDIVIEGFELESTVDTSNTVNMNETTPDAQGHTTLSSIIDIANSTNITVRKCKVHGSFTGMFIRLCYGVLVEDNECYESSSKIVCTSASQYRLVHNYIHDVKINGDDYYPCYLFQSTDTKTIKYQEASVIDGNRMLNNENWDAIMCHQYNGMVITNNFIKGVRTGIDLSLVASDSMNGNTIIDSNYIEQCANNRWTEPGIDHGIFIGGSYTDNENIIISNNIIKDFGKFHSPSGGCVVLIKDAQNVTLTGNVITFNSTLDSIYGAIILGNQLKNINVTSNTITCAGTLLPILFNTTTIENINITDNIFNSGRVASIDSFSTASVTNAVIKNSFSTTRQLYARNGLVLNNRTFSADNVQGIFSKSERYDASITGSTIAANGYSRVFINKSTIGRSVAFDSKALYSVSSMGATLPNDCFLRLSYADSSNLALFIYNNSGSSVTVPNFNVTIKIED